MSQMEDDVKDFLKRIVWSMFLGLVWLTTTLGIGTYNNLLVPEKSIGIGNIIFYIWMAGSLVGPWVARRLPPGVLRWLVALSGLALAVHLWLSPAG